MALEQGIDNCEAYDGYLAFMQKPPQNKTKKCNGNKRTRVSKKSNYQERTYNLHSLEKII